MGTVKEKAFVWNKFLNDAVLEYLKYLKFSNVTFQVDSCFLFLGLQFALFLFLYRSCPIQPELMNIGLYFHVRVSVIGQHKTKRNTSLNMLYDGNFTTHSSHAFRQVITARAR